jgi:hypothetical protein
MKFAALTVLVVGVVFAFLLWFTWWWPQMQEAVGR